MRRLVILAIVLAGCGDTDLPGGTDVVEIPPNDDPGEGSDTLRVDGTVEVTERDDAAVEADEFDTTFSVEVTLDGDELRDAVVTVASSAGTVELEFDSSGSIGRYRGSQAGYHGAYRLDVDSGDDFVESVVVQGPDVHTIDAPESGDAVPGDDDLVVRWTRSTEADIAEIESRETDRQTIDDTGTFTIDASDLRRDSNRDEDERVRVYRTMRIVPTGAVSGSELEVRLRNSVEFIVEAP